MTIVAQVARKAVGAAQRTRVWAERRKLEMVLKRYQLPSIAVEELVPRPFLPAEPILDDICMPPYYGNGTYIQNDFGALMRIVADRDPRLVFEYGTAHGNTVANICKYSRAHVITLNALAAETSGDGRTFDLAEEDIGRVYRRHGYAERVTQVLTDSLTFEPSAWLDEGSLDLVVVDACHDTDYVLSDFKKIVPYVRPAGIVLLHDTHPSMRRHLRTSYLACSILRQRGFDVRHLENTWWACWTRTA